MQKYIILFIIEINLVNIRAIIFRFVIFTTADYFDHGKHELDKGIRQIILYSWRIDDGGRLKIFQTALKKSRSVYQTERDFGFKY